MKPWGTPAAKVKVERFHRSQIFQARGAYRDSIIAYYLPADTGVVEATG